MKTNDTIKLFARFHAMYGNKWVSAYPDSKTVKMAVAVWTDELAEFPPDWIDRGVKAWKRDWPPSLPEFQKACLPDIKDIGVDIDRIAMIRVAGDVYNFRMMAAERSYPAYEKAIKEITEERQRDMIDDVAGYIQLESDQKRLTNDA